MSASLIIVPAGPGAGPVPGPDAVLVGLSLCRRAVLAAARAGIRDVRVAEPGAAWAEGVVTSGRHRIILLPANVIPQPSWLRRLAEMPLTPDTLWVDSADTVVVESERTSDVFEAARAAGSAVELVTALRISFGKVDGELDPRGRFVLESADDLPAAERWLLKSLIKDSEGFMSRHVERRISLTVTRLLVGTRVTPNLMTMVSLGIRAGASQVPRVALRGGPRLLGRQCRSRRRLLLHGPGLERAGRGGLAAAPGNRRVREHAAGGDGGGASLADAGRSGRAALGRGEARRCARPS